MSITLTTASTSSSALTPEPVPFHRVAHARGARRLWFRPLVALAVSALAYVLFGMLLLLATALVADVAPPRAVLEPSAGWADPLNPMDQVLGHGYDPLGQVGIGIFAVAMGLLAWKTGGIELPILLHAANNTTLFAIAPMIPGSTEQGEVTVLGFLATTVPLLLFTSGLWRWFDRREGLAPGEPCRGAAPARCARPVPAAAPTTLEA
ncbi:CPBP family intramembrane glutamic endopeptidase [Brachybacterium squillarum]|uniref:CPBP family intramembrane glutamic endopeptidase n=1 Tax=Brachybacterium squillarum TaxID=661979 RepID=UPI000315866E|nr:CPBP family intramembrane glutamic endopeptidase [Brachybacterium squillarum]